MDLIEGIDPIWSERRPKPPTPPPKPPSPPKPSPEEIAAAKAAEEAAAGGAPGEAGAPGGEAGVEAGPPKEASPFELKVSKRCVALPPSIVVDENLSCLLSDFRCAVPGPECGVFGSWCRSHRILERGQVVFQSFLQKFTQ